MRPARRARVYTTSSTGERGIVGEEWRRGARRLALALLALAASRAALRDFCGFASGCLCCALRLDLGLRL